jgi:5-methylcytosine-specific restriction protein A
MLLAVHRRRERNRGLVARKKRAVLKDTGKLECEVCTFDFRARYGDVGRGFAECHHDVPLATLAPGRKTKASDLRHRLRQLPPHAAPESAAVERGRP